MLHSFDKRKTSLQQKTLDGAYCPISIDFLDEVEDVKVARVVSIEEKTMIEHYIYYEDQDPEFADLIVLEGK